MQRYRLQSELQTKVEELQLTLDGALAAQLELELARATQVRVRVRVRANPNPDPNPNPNPNPIPSPKPNQVEREWNKHEERELLQEKLEQLAAKAIQAPPPRWAFAALVRNAAPLAACAARCPDAPPLRPPPPPRLPLGPGACERRSA